MNAQIKITKKQLCKFFLNIREKVRIMKEIKGKNGTDVCRKLPNNTNEKKNGNQFKKYHKFCKNKAVKNSLQNYVNYAIIKINQTKRFQAEFVSFSKFSAIRRLRFRSIKQFTWRTIFNISFLGPGSWMPKSLKSPSVRVTNVSKSS